MLKTIAFVYGIVFVLIGVLGFIPAVSPSGMLFGMFHVNAMHNIVHLITGVIAFWTAMTSMQACKLFFQIFGVIYLIVAILGFIAGDDNVLGVLANNMPDSWFHLLVAIVSLYAGFKLKAKKSSR